MMTRRAKYGWTFLIYFIEGLPFGIFADALPIYLRAHGMSLSEIGFVNALQVPWSLKVLWSPLVDRLGAPRQWIFACLWALAAVHAGLAACDVQGRLSWGWPLAILLFGLTCASATQDIAIDGYFVRLMGPGEEEVGNGIRVAAYRAALALGGGGTVMLATRTPWWQIFMLVSGVFLALSLVVVRTPAVDTPPPIPWRGWTAMLWRWVSQPGALGAFVFVLLYKLGDVSMGAMVRPFWVDSGATPAEIGAMHAAGIGATMAGALVGGWYTQRAGILRSLWVMGLFQAFSNLGYAGVARLPTAMPGHWGLYAASAFESLTQGLGTAAHLALLTRMCDREHAATQFAALTAMFGLTRALANGLSGMGAESMGYAGYFALTFTLSFPAYLFLPAVGARLRQIPAKPA